MEHARERLRRGQRHDASDADDPEGKPSTSIFKGLWNYALGLLHTSPFKRIVKAQAQATADSAAAQTKAALALGGDYDPDMSSATDAFATGLFSTTEEHMRSSVDRAEEVLSDWEDMEDPDIETLPARLDDGLSGIVGKAINSAVLAFGYLFGKSVELAQRDAGVVDYAWTCQADNRVRSPGGPINFGHHLELDEKPCSWSDPPLSADLSTSGEPCHPGEDYGCRCTASPLANGETLEEEDE